jgi:multiple sugar transport system substrate-binding protein
MLKKFTSIVMILLLTLTVFAGCQNKNNAQSVNNGNNKDTSKEEKTTIKYLTFSAGPDHIEDLEKMIAGFEKENPNIKVEYEILPWGDYFTKLQTLIASGTAPDTFELNYENFVTYASKNVLLDLTSLIDSEGFDVNIYNKKALDAFKLKGKQYGLVESFSNVVLFYNKDLFDKAGVSYPDDSWDWDKEVEAAKKLTDKEKGIWGTYAPIQFWEFYKTIEQNGGKIFNEDKSEVVINSKNNVETLQWMIDKISEYNVTPNDAQMSGQSDGDLFKSGKIAMLRTGIWMFDSFKDADFKWDIALEPGKTQKAHHFFSNGVAINSKTENPEAAWKWIKYLTSSSEAAKIRIESSWELPAVEDEAILKGYLEKEPPQSREVVFKALDTLVVPPVIENWNELTDAVGKELEKAKIGEKTPQEALDSAKAAIEKLLK